LLLSIGINKQLASPDPGASAPQQIEPATAGKSGGMPGYVIAIIVAAIILLAALLAAAFYVVNFLLSFPLIFVKKSKFNNTLC